MYSIAFVFLHMDPDSSFFENREFQKHKLLFQACLFFSCSLLRSRLLQTMGNSLEISIAGRKCHVRVWKNCFMVKTLRPKNDGPNIVLEPFDL